VLEYEQGDVDAAIMHLEKAVDAGYPYAKAHYSLAIVQYRAGNYDQAIYALQKVLELDPQNANAHFDLAIILVEKFRQEEDAGSVDESDLFGLQWAISEYQSVVRIDPKFPYAASNAEIVEKVLNEYLPAQ
jgi:tetratricopeptide (TPR) repeat protein